MGHFEKLNTPNFPKCPMNIGRKNKLYNVFSHYTTNMHTQAWLTLSPNAWTPCMVSCTLDTLVGFLQLHIWQWKYDLSFLFPSLILPCGNAFMK